MNVLSILDKLEAAAPDPVYLLHGPQRFLIDRLVARLKELVVGGPMADFNISRHKVGETTGSEIVSEARSVPMMASGRLVILEDAHKLKATDMEVLDLYLAKPVNETCLVLVGEKFDLRRGMFSRANKRGQVHKAEALAEREIVPFIKRRAKERGVNLSGGAQAAICSAVGPDCAALDDAVERSGLYAGPGGTVSQEDVEQVVSSLRQHTVFELVDAIGNRRQANALALLAQLLSRREEPLRLSAMLSRHIRQLIGARVLIRNGTDDRGMASVLGVPPFVARKLSEQAGRFQGAELESALARLARTDVDLKSSRRSGGLILEETVMDLC